MFNFMRLPPLRRMMLMKAITGGGSWSTVTGNPVSFSAKAAPLKQLQIAFSPKQDLHGYDSPWPAGGGKNKFDGEWESGVINTSTGQPEPGSTSIRTKNYIPVDGGNDYVLSWASPSLYILLFTYHADKSFSRYVGAITISGSKFTTNADEAFVRFYTLSNTTIPTEMQFEKGSSVTTYSPYSNICPISGWDSLTVYHSGADTSDPQTISISLGQTVYSGWVDVISGVGDNDKRMLVLNSDMAIVPYDFQGKHGVAFKNVLPEQMTRASGMCSHSGYVGAYFDENAIWLGVSSQYIYWIGILDILGLSTVDEFKAWLDTQTVQLLFPISNHDEITVTPQEVESLRGENNMWSNANQPITVEYRSN